MSERVLHHAIMTYPGVAPPELVTASVFSWALRPHQELVVRRLEGDSLSPTLRVSRLRDGLAAHVIKQGFGDLSMIVEDAAHCALGRTVDVGPRQRTRSLLLGPSVVGSVLYGTSTLPNRRDMQQYGSLTWEQTEPGRELVFLRVPDTPYANMGYLALQVVESGTGRGTA